MTAAPAIVFGTSATAQNVNVNVFTYTIFANDKVFSDWSTWALDENNKSVATTNQIKNATKYSGYSMKIYCDTSAVIAASPTAQAGCCMGDNSTSGTTNKGGFCLVSTASNAMQTYRMTST